MSEKTDNMEKEKEAMYYIKKIGNNEDYYLSPKKRRWISIKSTKHKFGKFTENEALEVMRLKSLFAPHADITLEPIN